MVEPIWAILRDMRRARKGGPAALEQLRRARVAAIVTHARTHSTFYRELYRDLPAHVDDVTLLPVTTKRELMDRFDDWVTDPEVTIEQARAFIDDPSRVGELFLGRYRVGTSSGSTGVRGIFLFDDRSTAVTSAMALRAFGRWLSWGGLAKVILRGGRVASVLATGGHFGSSTVLPRRSDGRRVGANRLRVFSVFTPMPELVKQLNSYRPSILIGYAGQIAMLAGEREAGRLRISPVLVMLGAEGLPDSGYRRVAEAFGAKTGNGYGACEFMSTAASCAKGWLHVNCDWVVVEPVDRGYRPVPPGEASHTVLITNLANRLQPILRYDLGDSLLVRPDACPCGDPFTAIRATGRASEALTFRDSGGRAVRVAPVALAGIVDRAPGLELAQVVQTSPTTLQVRVRAAGHADPEAVWRTIHREIDAFLAHHNLAHVAISRSDKPPEQSAGGKYRLIIPLGTVPENGQPQLEPDQKRI